MSSMRSSHSRTSACHVSVSSATLRCTRKNAAPPNTAENRSAHANDTPNLRMNLRPADWIGVPATSALWCCAHEISQVWSAGPGVPGDRGVRLQQDQRTDPGPARDGRDGALDARDLASP